MKILIVAATHAEVDPLLAHFAPATFHFLVTGVGMVATAFAMACVNNIGQYSLVLNLGIAGSFDRDIALGSVIEVTEDAFAELGAEDGDDFIPIDTLGFGQSRYYPTAQLADFTAAHAIRQAKAITVNKVHGNTASINTVLNRLNPQLESMEGAAFFYACKQLGVRGVQIRAVSNYVERRNRDSWKIGLAVKNLNNFAIELVGLLTRADD